MYEELADFDIKELTEQVAEAFYTGCNNHAKTLLEELQWRMDNTSI